MGSLFLFTSAAVLFSLTTITRSSVVIDIEKLVEGIKDKPVVLANQLVVGDDDSIIDSVDSSSVEEFPDDSFVSDSDESSESDGREDEEDDGLPQILEMPEKQKSPLQARECLQAKTTTHVRPSIKNGKLRVDLDQFPDNLLVDIFYRMSGIIRLERAWRIIVKMRALNRRMNALMGGVLERLSMDHPFFANQSKLIATHIALSHPRFSHTWTSEDQAMYDWLENKSMFSKYMHRFVQQNNNKSLLFDTSIPTSYLYRKEAQTIRHSLWCVGMWVSAFVIVFVSEYCHERSVYSAFMIWVAFNISYLRYWQTRGIA